MNDASLQTATSGTPPVDDEGYLINPADWDEGVAETLARKKGIVLTDLHWQVLRFMRSYLDERPLIPDARFVIWFLEKDVGLGAAARQRLFELFPYGYVRQACKVARHAPPARLKHRLRRRAATSARQACGAVEVPEHDH